MIYFSFAKRVEQNEIFEWGEEWMALYMCHAIYYFLWGFKLSVELYRVCVMQFTILLSLMMEGMLLMQFSRIGWSIWGIQKFHYAC